ncbi:MAG TPA: HD domain-containing protein [Vicinamibacterales bacterium]|nr:HD domain-containing protein [Vicinamibacterales bacterium]
MHVGQAELRVRQQQALDAARGELVASTERGEGGRQALARFSDAVDEILRDLVEAVAAETGTPIAVCALGGYGRRALSLHSDIDLLLLVGGRIGRPEERFVKALLHPLWDLKFAVGHHVRELDDFDRLETDNPEFLLALMDLRQVAGDRALFDRFDGILRASSGHWHPQILDALVTLTDERHIQFQDTLYQLEPDVKDGPGTLRDIWATRTILKLAGEPRAAAAVSAPDRLRDAEEFLMQVRSGIHLDMGRNVNVLSYELQEKAADRLKYVGPDARRRAEALMTDYFRHARAVTRVLGRVRRAAKPVPATPIRLIGQNLMWVVEGITFADMKQAAAFPVSWLRAFEAAASRNVQVADEALALMEREQEANRHAPGTFLPTAGDRHRLMQFLRPRQGLAAHLADMRDCGLLGALFPEFDEISCRVTRDFYHKYTVDEHTLLTVRNVERLLDHPRFGPVLRELPAPELLVLALLYHDVGKAREGNHSEVSADMAVPMMERLGLDDHAKETILFLIRNHLKMSRVAFRRDTEEPEVVKQFASLFSTEDHLKLLWLLTLADVGAVSPDTLTGWKEELLWRLYVDAYNQMTLGYGDEIIDRSEAAAQLRAGRPDDISEPEIAKFLEGLPRRYLMLFTPEAIYRHVRLSRDVTADDAHFFLENKAAVWELTVVSLDKPFLFSNISGVLSYYGMDIVRGHALTSLTGLVLDVFQFIDRDRFFERNSQGRQQFDRTLIDVVAGRTDIRALLKNKERSVVFRRAPLVRRTPVIYFDNEHSQRYTVLELVADDAPGLLHRVSRVISEHGVDVDLVLISTEGQKAIDVFHITRGGAKLAEDAEAALKGDLDRMLKESA